MEEVLAFLNELKKNNNREWFKENKSFYEKAKFEFGLFINTLIPKIKEFDNSINVFSEKECVFRIYRDVRFGKNKQPYKNNFGAYIAKGGRKSINAGYFIQIEPENSFIGGGVYMPQPYILKAIRDDIFFDSSEFKAIINNKNFTKYFNEIVGSKLKTAPRGFPKDFVDVELLRHKSYAVTHQITDQKLLSNNFESLILGVFKAQKPFNYYINKIIDNIN